jgi:hypothetical protein
MTNSPEQYTEKELKPASWEDLLAWAKQNPQELIDWVEQQPEYADLVEQAKRGTRLTPEKPSPLVAMWQWIAAQLIVAPRSLYGRAYVTKALQEDASKTAGVLTVANLWNGATALPFVIIGLKDLPLGFLLALLAAIGLVKFSNDCGAAAAANQPAKRGWSKAAMTGLVSMNIGLTAISGPGTELAMNQAGLSQMRAQEIVDELVLSDRHVEIDNAKRTLNESDRLAAECMRKEKELKSLREEDPRRDSLYLEMYGDWALRNSQIWSTTPSERLPICRRASRMQGEGLRQQQVAKQALDAQQVAINQEGGSLIFLANKKPELYATIFTPGGQIESGVEASRLAFQSFNNKLFTGKWNSLGFAMFSFGISVITSGVAVYLTAAHARRKDVQLSYEQSILDARNQFFMALSKGLRQQKNDTVLASVSTAPMNGHRANGTVSPMSK